MASDLQTGRAAEPAQAATTQRRRRSSPWSSAPPFTVAHNRREVLAKTDAHAKAPVKSGSAWVAFDVPGSSTPVILDVSFIKTVQ